MTYWPLSTDGGRRRRLMLCIVTDLLQSVFVYLYTVGLLDKVSRSNVKLPMLQCTMLSILTVSCIINFSSLASPSLQYSPFIPDF